MPLAVIGFFLATFLFSTPASAASCTVAAISTPGTCKTECGAGEQSWGSCTDDNGGNGQCCIGNASTSCKGQDGGKEVTGFCQKSCDPTKDIKLGSCDGGICCYPISHQLQAKGSSVKIENPLGAGTTLYTIINRIIRAFLGMVGALAFAVFVYAGIVWMTAGSSERVQHAKDAMKYAVIGLLMIGFSFAITNFIIDALVRQPTTNSQDQGFQPPTDFELAP
jgi:hypothetical protein